jgi:hypothetical protein
MVAAVRRPVDAEVRAVAALRTGVELDRDLGCHVLLLDDLVALGLAPDDPFHVQVHTWPGLTMKKTGPISRTDAYSSCVSEMCSKHDSSAHSHMNSVNIGLRFVEADSIRSFTSRNSD